MQLDLLHIPKQRSTKQPELSGAVVRNYVKDSIRDLSARQKERDGQRRKKIERVVIPLTEPQVFALTVILENTLDAALPSRFTASYNAVLRKLKASGKMRERDRTLFDLEVE